MPFTDVPEVPIRQGAGTGISMSLRILKGGKRKVRLTFSAEQQKALFGGPIKGRAFLVQAGRGSDEGLLRVEPVDADGFTANDGIKGSASLTVGGWDLLPKDKRPAASLTVKTMVGKAVILQLPSWAKPSGAGGAMEAEFGIKRAAKRP